MFWKTGSALRHHCACLIYLACRAEPDNPNPSIIRPPIHPLFRFPLLPPVCFSPLFVLLFFGVYLTLAPSKKFAAQKAQTGSQWSQACHSTCVYPHLPVEPISFSIHPFASNVAGSNCPWSAASLLMTACTCMQPISPP